MCSVPLLRDRCTTRQGTWAEQACSMFCVRESLLGYNPNAHPRTLTRGLASPAAFPIASSSRTRGTIHGAAGRDDRLQGLLDYCPSPQTSTANRRHCRSHRHPAISLCSCAPPVKMCVCVCAHRIGALVLWPCGTVATLTRLQGSLCFSPGASYCSPKTSRIIKKAEDNQHLQTRRR